MRQMPNKERHQMTHKDTAIEDVIERLEAARNEMIKSGVSGWPNVALEAITALKSIKPLQEQLAAKDAENVQFRHWIEGQYSSQLCCSGYECGCMGATQGQEIIYHIEREAKKAQPHD